MSEKWKNTRFVLLINTLIATLYINGQHFTQQTSLKRYILAVMVVSFLVVFIPMLIYSVKFMNKPIKTARLSIYKKMVWLFNNPRKAVKVILIYTVAALISLLVTLVYSKLKNYHFVWPLFHMSLALLFVPVTVYLCRNNVSEKPEILFLILIVLTGTCFINACPTELGIAWDDEAHYERSVGMADLTSGITYKSDEEVLIKQPTVALEHFGYSEKDRIARNNYLEELWAKQTIIPYVYAGIGNVAALSYIPFAFGITMGRGLHLPYTIIFRLGKITNLITYSVIVYFAMKRLKFGKIILGCIAFLPTMIFLASGYSYDPCVVGCMMLGFSVFFSYLQQPESKIKNIDIALICISFFLACLPKAVYCVIMLPLLFMPSNRFVSNKQHRMYILSGCITVGILAASFVIPILLQGVGTGDARGGEAVNASEQLKYILNNPIKFFQILQYFLLNTYLHPSHAIEFMENYAYLGINYYNFITPIVLLITAFLDRNGQSGKNHIIYFSTLLGLLFGVLIVAFTFYLAFTPVAYFTVLGCQPRYLLPILFPFLYVIGIDRVKNPVPTPIFHVAPMLWMCCSFIIYTGIVLVSLY